MNLAVLASGSGTNLEALLESEKSGRLGARVRLVISNRREAGALERARRAGRAALHLSPAELGEAAFTARLLQEFERFDIGLVCLAGYLKKLPEGIVTSFAGKILNIHPAPLPRFGGAGMYGLHVHRAVLASGLSHSGPTVHFVDLGYDTGPVIAHWPVPVHRDDTPETLAARVLEAEHRLYPAVVAEVASGRIRLVDGRVEGRLNVG